MTGKRYHDIDRSHPSAENAALVLQAGGTLDPRRHLYIRRKSDAELLDILKTGEFANVLTSRQMGKSSLMVQTVHELDRLGFSWASIDVGAELGSKESLETFYLGFMNALSRQLSIDLDVRKFWNSFTVETSNQKLMGFFREIIRQKPEGQIVVFIDEIDATLKVDYADDLFVAIRGLYNERALHSELRRLSFCILGVTTPNELIKDRRTTPYNIGQTIQLSDFAISTDDLTPFRNALHSDHKLADILLERVLFWTDGHPYLTNLLCKEAVSASVVQAEEIDAIVKRLFSNLQTANVDVHFQQILRFVRGRLSDGSAALRLYRRIVRGDAVQDATTLSHSELKLSGLVKRNSDGHLIVRNRIYEQLFDLSWIDSIDDLRTQQTISPGRLILWTMFVGSVTLSIVSGYETWLGLLDFMPPGFVGQSLSFVLAFGTHMLLLAISWSIADTVRRGVLDMVPRLFVWSMVGFFSAYFSFFGFFEATGGRDENVRRELVAAESDRIITQIDSKLAAMINEQHQSKLIGATDYRSWQDHLQLIILEAEQAEALIIENASRELVELRDQTMALRVERNELNDNLARLNAKRELAAANTESIRRNLTAAQDRVNELQLRVRESTDRRDALSQQLEQEALTGRGARYRSLEIDLNTALAELSVAEELLTSAEAQQVALQNDLTDAEVLAADSEQDQELANLEGALVRLDVEFELLNRHQERLEGSTNFNARTELDLLSSAQENVELKQYTAMEEISQQCQRLKQLLYTVDTNEDVQGINCQPSSIYLVISSLQEKQAQYAQFQEVCDGITSQFFQETEEAGLLIDPVFDHLQSCLEFESDLVLRADLNTDLESMRSMRGDQNSKINQGATALFEDRQSNAVISVIFAVVVDLLILLMALVGRNAGLPESARAIDKLIRLTRKSKVMPEGFEGYLLVPDDPSSQGLIYTALSRLLREDLAVFMDDDTNVSMSRLMLRKGATAYLQRMRSIELTGRDSFAEMNYFSDTVHGNRKSRSRVEPS